MAVLELLHGDCRTVMAGLPAASVDAVVCDPPYHLTSIVKRFGNPNSAPAQYGTDGVYARSSKGFMGKVWDGGDVAFQPEIWAAALRVAKPGAHLLAFGGTRTFHRLAVAIEDAGWEIRDTVMWVYGSGFPKSHNVGKGIDKAAGAEREVVGHGRSGRNLSRNGHKGDMAIDELHQPPIAPDITAPATVAAEQWEGWGTALKPAWEPIIVARKPLEGTVAANVLAHGTGAINIDGCRVGTSESLNGGAYAAAGTERDDGWGMQRGGAGEYQQPTGRWPANLIHDGSDEVLAAFPVTTSGSGNKNTGNRNGLFGKGLGAGKGFGIGGDTGSAARFFYCAKASKADRDEGCEGMQEKHAPHGNYEGRDMDNPKNHLGGMQGTQARNHHPTVKPTALMRYLCKLVTPPAGTVLDPFMGSGSTGKAARMDGFGFIGIEQDADYIAIARARIAHAVQSPAQQPLHI